ncbi:hypothetical protein [Oceanobacillus oncorhynchi]|uniref:hypothetical protein n=1 Tax=Oceanobacillus oncorhynchi TaxID=545501 RepID=UPI0018678222|nr:hypothetical protein [Oceanobacillus oncorhynchi]
MTIAFQIILLIVILFTCLGTLGARNNENLRTNSTAICISAIAALLISALYL